MPINELLTRLNLLDLPADQYIVVGSGTLAVLGIREANDIDLLASEELWQRLTRDFGIIEKDGREYIIPDELIEIQGPGSFYDNQDIATYEIIAQTAEIIEGIRFINLDLLLKFKTKMGREKDTLDIALINEYLLEDQLIEE